MVPPGPWPPSHVVHTLEERGEPMIGRGVAGESASSESYRRP